MDRPAEASPGLPSLWLRASGFVLLAIAAAGFAGHLLGLPKLCRLYLQSSPLSATAVLALALFGVGLLGFAGNRGRVLQSCSVAVGLFAVLNLASHFLYRRSVIDDAFAHISRTDPASVEMASSSAGAMFLASLAMAALTGRSRRPRFVAVVGGVLLGIVLLVILGYLSGFRPASSWANFTGMSLPGAVGLLLVALTAILWTWRAPDVQSPSIPLAAAAAVILASVGIISLRSSDALTAGNRWVRHTFEVRDALEQIVIDLNTADDARRLFNQKADEKYAAAFAKAAAECRKDVEDAILLVSDDDSQEHLALQLRGLVSTKLAQGAGAMEERRHLVTSLDQRSRNALVAYELTRPIQRIVDEMLTVEQGLLLKRSAETERVAGQTRTLLIMGSYVAAGLVAIALALALAAERARRRAEADLVLVNDQLRSAHAAAQESTRLKAQFLANMSHEIRTPMNGVIGMVGLLNDTELTSEQRLITDTIRSSADVLLNLLNDILDLSKIEAGQLIVNSDPFDLREPIETCLGILAERAHAKGLELAYLVEEDVPVDLVGDSARLQQILINLVGNAVKFTERGEVVLRVSRASAGVTGTRLRFEVRDTGIGVAPQVQPRLFQPFVQADGGTSRVYGGTGLGLAICRQLVHLMGGTIGFESVPSRGSTFWFEIALGVRRPPAERHMPGPAQARVLVVDDNEQSRGILARRCAARGLATRQAGGGAEALSTLRSAAGAGEPFAVVIADFHMPSMSGLVLAREVRADPLLAGTKAILLTSFGSSVSQEDIESAGISARLNKPPRDSLLHEAIAAALAGRPAPVPGQAPGETGALPSASGLRVLVAEDNVVNQQVARLQLGKLGCHPDVVADGAEAVQAARSDSYDLILMDCQMPGVDGYEATRRIRRWEDERRARGERFVPVHVIAMTANAMLGDRDACFAAGMNDYVAKPVMAADLAAVFARLPGWSSRAPVS
jgi:signal transduction histidine kinase/DNA-binding response OmpR family regulator